MTSEQQSYTMSQCSQEALFWLHKVVDQYLSRNQLQVDYYVSHKGFNGEKKAWTRVKQCVHWTKGSSPAVKPKGVEVVETCTGCTVDRALWAQHSTAQYSVSTLQQSTPPGTLRLYGPFSVPHTDFPVVWIQIQFLTAIVSKCKKKFNFQTSNWKWENTCCLKHLCIQNKLFELYGNKLILQSTQYVLDACFSHQYCTTVCLQMPSPFPIVPIYAKFKQGL